MKIQCIIGVGGVGKTTYCDQLVANAEAKGQPRPFLLKIGHFFREFFGPNFFTPLDNPTAPAITEFWVREMVDKAIQTVYEISASKDFGVLYGETLLIDGFPRTREQIHWLMLSSFASTRSIPVHITALYVSDEVHNERLNKRKMENPMEADLVEKRATKDVALLIGVTQELKNLRSEGKYPQLSFKELDL